MWLVMITILVACVVKYIRDVLEGRRYWLKRGIPYSEPFWPVGCLGKLLTNQQSYPELMSEMYNEQPDSPIMGIFILTEPALMIKDAQMLSRVLCSDFTYFHMRGLRDDYNLDPLMENVVNMDGPKWKTCRSAMGPIFTSKILESFHPSVVASAEELYSTLRDASGGSAYIQTHCHKFTFNVISNLLFSDHADPVTARKLNECISQTFKPNKFLNIRSILRSAWPSLISLLRWKRLPVGTENFLQHVVEMRIASNKNHDKPDDILQHLIDNFIYSNAGLNAKDVAANIFGLFTAGVDTTGFNLAACLFELSVHQDIQQTLRREINSVLVKHSGNLTHEAVHEMTYLGQVISEALRMYPTASVVGRECTKNYQLPNTDVILVPGTKLVVPITAIHYDPKHYPEPHKFNPGRFSPDNVASIPRTAYIPFGAGPRMCIGYKLATLELKTAVAVLISRMRFRPNIATDIPLKFKSTSVLLSPTRPIILDVECLS